jgi:hypothetical protein
MMRVQLLDDKGGVLAEVEFDLDQIAANIEGAKLPERTRAYALAYLPGDLLNPIQLEIARAIAERLAI